MNKLLKKTNIFLGALSVVWFICSGIVLVTLRPKLISFEEISSSEEIMLNIVGFGLILVCAFLGLSLLRLASYFRNTEKIKGVYILLTISGVISLLFVFSDIALLSDIGKQYKYGLAQPEWTLLPPIMGFQLISTVVLLITHIKLFKDSRKRNVMRDSNIFTIAQYVGVICGLTGLSLSSLGFFFSGAWDLSIHSIAGSVLSLVPYLLVCFFWLVTKLQEKDREWYDEKQLQDIGKSSFVTLLSSVVFMTSLFILNIRGLDGVISLTWLPLYLFWVLTVFSLGNLYFGSRG